MKDYGKIGGIVASILNLGTICKLVISFTPQPFYPPTKEAKASIQQGVSVFHTRFGHISEMIFLAPAGNRTTMSRSFSP